MPKGYLSDEKYMVALGRIPKASHIHKFGSRTGINTTSTTVWDDGLVTYPWSAFDSTQALTIVGASDAGKSVTVVGLDENYDEIEETIEVGSTGGILFKRVYRAFVNGTVANAGETIVAQIRTGYAQTLMCVYTVPRNHTGLMLKGVATCSADKDMLIEFYGRFLGEDGNYTPFRIQHIANIYQNNYQYEFGIPLALPEKTDLDVRVRGYSNDSGAKVSAAFDIVLYEDKTDY
jgi:hypothetical protein